MPDVRLKRVYDPPDPEDGRRVLIDRLWPRGISKNEARVDAWLRDVAPSDELRRFFGHDPARWEEFRARYRVELEAPERAAALEQLRAWAAQGRVTLLFAARDAERNNAVVLKERLEEGGGSRG
ncbi:MAG: DUF488 domain-containing protein [Firmicutes bacterium]|nr:DUF488 domain-containing protein [Bacillota bacterium]MBE3590884.1 DUF488 domain-containing protein [Bacillota bacterium]